MARPKKYTTSYTLDSARQEATFREYLSCVADCFGEPYDDREERDAPSIRGVCAEFNISIPKARKLLLTAGMYSTEKSRQVAELYAQGKSLAEIGELIGLKRSSVSSYLPYQKFSYKMDEISRHAEDSRKYRERKKAVAELKEKIIDLKAADIVLQLDIDHVLWEAADAALWQAVIAYQNYPLHTSTGLLFTYTIKRNKHGEYSGEVIVSRKEGSKTLTRSSVILAFHKVLDGIRIAEVCDKPGAAFSACGKKSTELLPTEYKGPKAIGQIFGISYIYSLFWKWGLISVPEKVEDKLKGKK